ncbi:mediator of RNA polymerase II transcription subunit 15a-like [Papaver somniferum]|uniref:mediator of RNA polymerase II transcription subunit 15a-like n=1 Tax=Papaver somniferum TaxID=3469 RepID=UPI000E705519|nr:mediator of RNA polymerase II transcription subunit 15a-like [Papaver somniferum]
MDATDWRTQLQLDSRQRIVTKIMETLKRCVIISGPEGLVELNKIAVRFEEKIFTAATSQTDYLRKISLKMLTMETKSKTNGVANSLPLNTGGGSQNPQDPACQCAVRSAQPRAVTNSFRQPVSSTAAAVIPEYSE